MSVTLKQLRFLLVLAKHRQFTSAAESIGVTQPALSSAIRDLETYLNGALLERDSKGCKLTPLGKKTAQYAKIILEETDKLTESCLNQSPLSGSFKIGVIPTIAPYFMPLLIEDLLKTYPNLDLEIIERHTDWILNALSHKELDAALIAKPYPIQNDIKTANIGKDDFYAIMLENHPLAKKDVVTLEDIDTNELILLKDEHCLTLHVLQVCKQKPNLRANIFRATSLLMLVQTVLQGLGISILTNMAVRSILMRDLPLIIKPIYHNKACRQISYAWNSSSVRKKDITLMKHSLKTYYEQFYT